MKFLKMSLLNNWISLYTLSKHSRVYGDAVVNGEAKVHGKAQVYRKARISDFARVFDTAKVRGKAQVQGYAMVSGDAIVESSNDYFVLTNHWSSRQHFTYTRSNQLFRVGCFLGTGDELIAKAYKDSQLSGDCYKASVQYVQELEQVFHDNKK